MDIEKLREEFEGWIGRELKVDENNNYECIRLNQDFRAFEAGFQAHAALREVKPEAIPTKIKPHQFRELVNTLRDIAVEFHANQSLRERIAYAVSYYVMLEAAAVPMSDERILELLEECSRFKLKLNIAALRVPVKFARALLAANGEVKS